MDAWKPIYLDTHQGYHRCFNFLISKEVSKREANHFLVVGIGFKSSDPLFYKYVDFLI